MAACPNASHAVSDQPTLQDFDQLNDWQRHGDGLATVTCDSPAPWTQLHNGMPRQTPANHRRLTGRLPSPPIRPDLVQQNQA